jgi:hypothetical protein
VSKEATELKDWLGFVGNVLAAFFTLIAAVIAWHDLTLAALSFCIAASFIAGLRVVLGP